MRGLKVYIKAFFMAAIILLLPLASVAEPPFVMGGPGGPGGFGAQGGPGGPGGGGQGGQEPMVTGTVESIGSSSISLTTDSGARQELYLTSETRFVKEISLKPDEIKINDRVLVIGQSLDTKITANMIKVLDPSDAFAGGPPQSGGFGAGPQGAGMQGPAIGSVTSLSPLTVRLSTGESRTVEVSGSTQVAKEVAAGISGIKAGSRAMLIAPFMGGSRRVIKVVALEGGAVGMGGPGPGGPMGGGGPMEESFGAKAGGAEWYASKPALMRGSPLNYLDSPFGILDAPPRHFDAYGDLGVRWVSTGFKLGSWEDIERQKGVYDFSSTDAALKSLYENGLNVLIELRPIHRLYGTRFVEHSTESREYPEGNVDAYINFVREFVRRYSTGTVPGVKVKYYQFVHELAPSFKNDFWKMNQGKYAELYARVHKIVKDVCPDCRVVLVGGEDAGDYMSREEGAKDDGFFVKVFNEFKARGIKLQDIAFNYEFWSNPAKIDSRGEDYLEHKRFLDTIKRLYRRYGYKDSEVEIISGEAGMAGHKTTERHQAAYLVKIYALSLANGQKKIFWTTTFEYGRPSTSAPEPPLIFFHTGLVHNSRNSDGLSHKKLAYYSYKLLAEKLENADLSTAVALSEGKDNVYAYRFTNRVTKKPVIVAWWDYFREGRSSRDSKQALIYTGAPSAAVTVTAAVPEGESGMEITAGPRFDNTRTAANPAGVLSLTLKDSPVYIEPVK